MSLYMIFEVEKLEHKRVVWPHFCLLFITKAQSMCICNDRLAICCLCHFLQENDLNLHIQQHFFGDCYITHLCHLFQIGCPNCGFSYCSKCLKLKAPIPKLGNVVYKVCKSCHAALSESGGNAKSPKEEYSSPVSLLKLVLFFIIKRKCTSFPCLSLFSQNGVV